MTVTATNASSGPFSGNGSTTVFSFTFEALSTSEVQVLVDGVAQSSGFTVALNAGGAGGDVTFTTAPATGKKILILSNPSLAQNVSFQNAGAFLPESHEEALDRAAIRDISLKNDLERSLRVAIGETLAPLPASADRANKYFTFDGSGVPLMTSGPVVTSASGQAVNTRVDLASISSPVAGQVAILAEAGREGVFVFNASNLSAQVSADTGQDTYVAPASAVTGASGAWVRIHSRNTFSNTVLVSEDKRPTVLNSAGTDDRTAYRVVHKKNGFTNGPVGHENYTDYVHHRLFNLKTDQTLDNATIGGVAYSEESKFWAGAAVGFATESIMLFVPVTGASYRPIQWMLAHDATKRGVSGGTIRVDKFDLQDQLAVQIFTFDTYNKLANFSAGAKINFGVNNVPIYQQLNAAGSAYVSGPYLSSYDNWHVTRPHYYTGSPAANDLGIRAGFTSFDTSAVADNRGYYAKGGAITGAFYPFDGVADCTDAVIGRVRNTSASGKAVFDLVGNTASLAEYRVNGTKVVGARGAAIADDASGAANQATVNAILAALRAHGLIAP